VLRRADPGAAVPAGAAAAALAAALVDAFAFVDIRRPGEIAIRVLPPDAVVLDGDRAPGTVIEVACEDRDFIITSLTEELHRLGHRVTRMLRVSFGRARDEHGHLLWLGPARGAAEAESFLEIELERRLDGARADEVVAALRQVLAEVFRATDDHAAMRELMLTAAERTRRNAGTVFASDEVAESVALIDWLLDGHCVLLGTCLFPVLGDTPGVGGVAAVGEADDGTALGVLRDPHTALRRPPGEAPTRLLDVARLPEVSRVHRQMPMQRFDLSVVDEHGRVDGLGRLVCVFSRRAEAFPVQAIPLLRWKLQRLLELEDAVEGSYDEQAVTSLFQALPKDDLFCGTVEDLHRTVRGLLAEDREHRVRVLMRAEPGARAVSVLITMPSELYTRAQRRRLEAFLLAQLDGDRVDVDLSMGGSTDTVARFLVHLAPDRPTPSGLDAVAREVQLLCRTWEQRLVAALEPVAGDRARRLAASWADRFPASYADAVDPAEAALDVAELDALAAPAADEGREPGGGEVRVRVSGLAGLAGGGEARLTVTSADAAVELSGLLPILESLGLWTVDELHWEVGAVHLHRVTVRDRTGAALDVDRDGPRLADATLALWHGRADVDSLNRLVLRAGLGWADVAVLRAYRRYRRQVDPRYTDEYANDVLVAHPEVARLVLDLFRARFDPAGADEATVAALSAALSEACDRVERLDHDRILRGLAGTVAATLRTNHHLRPEGPFAVKLDPAAVPDVPTPVPYREIFVHSPTVEGVHLRAGPVARGGLRFSDRPEDYRSEVLDLVRTQVLKNALIVPTGAKGGFVLKGKGPAEDGRGAVRAAYEAFVTGLLDLTDDFRGQEVVAVPGRWDGDDPYLVVAADKGTAAFSDVANRLAVERGYWLGDAFASGGSVGYDHRALGITARGAWVAVARHFRELDVDVAADPFSVVGVGDMSGDVFGNGMLQSDRIRLVAAFDHRHVFLDPDPDPAAAHAERRRLFGRPGSSWQDYDPTRLSDGGGVHPRSRKRVELHPRVRDVLRVSEGHLTPAELIQAILRAPVDLLYLGGVGTYVRASTEPESVIDDRANSEVRVTADQLRARVVGEGANLGFTQRARIEYARRGGRINMDAIDNSAGVDTSDHEVNIKILLGLALEAGEIDPRRRVELLAGASDEVVAAVLADTAKQSDALSRARDVSAAELDDVEATQRDLVGAGLVDPVVEALPDSLQYEARRRAGAGLTRPELAVLLAGGKRRVKAAVLASPLPDELATRNALVGYFPSSLAERFDHLLDRHRLRRELVASEIANDLVDHLGPTLVLRLSEEAGATAHDVAAAYWVARGVTDAPALWSLLTAHGGPPPGAADAPTERADPGQVLAGLLESLTRSELFHRHRLTAAGEAHDLASRIGEDGPVFAELQAGLLELDRPPQQRARSRLVDRLVAGGLDRSVAVRVAVLPELDITPDVAALSRAVGRPLRAVTPAFLELSDRLGIDRLLERTRSVAPGDAWARAARQGLLDDLLGLRREATRRTLSAAGDPSGGDDDGLVAVERWLAGRTAPLAEATAVRRQVEADSTVALDGLAVAVRAVRRAVQ
jgi:glutamate dehydrogenase